MIWHIKKKNKFGAILKEYNGVVYHSKREANYAKDLDTLKKAKEIKGWRRQVKISIDINGFHICNLIVDFEVTNNDESVELHEVKGFETAVYRIKKKLINATYLKNNPSVKYVVIK
ncbi:hypothetical protein A2300_04005 [Candidatus Falkowbacteria bacterium RIFOXYB2_FULL_35_7]|nr:MAG: hypothetical protein A2300_04005 [Candidatus Falkowbacteria bacterium RIFOXYB2_FULL_35_7]